jgi:hypothetical protein
MDLVWPAQPHLASYVAALTTGWSSDTVRGKVAAEEQLAKIAQDADAFLAGLVDREGRGDPVNLPDGSTAKRLPGYVRWLWDGEYCGSIGLRWQPAPKSCPRIAWATLDIPWSRGSSGAVTRHRHCATFWATRATKGCATSRSPPTRARRLAARDRGERRRARRAIRQVARVRRRARPALQDRAGMTADGIVIVGGGIGGLTLALCLHERGIRCRVYEQAPKFPPAGRRRQHTAATPRPS